MIAWRVYADGSYRQGYAYAGALVVASDDTIVLEASLVSPIRPAKKKSPSAKAEMYAATCGLDLLQSVSRGDEYAILYIDNMQVMHFIEREGPEVKHDPFGDQLLAAVRREKHRFHVEHSKKRDVIHSHLAHFDRGPVNSTVMLTAPTYTDHIALVLYAVARVVFFTVVSAIVSSRLVKEIFGRHQES